MPRGDPDFEVRVEELDRRERELASKEARFQFRQRTPPPLNRSTSRRSHVSYVEDDDSEVIPPPPYVLRSVLRQPSYYSIVNRRRRSRSNASDRASPQDPTYYDRYGSGLSTPSNEASSTGTRDDFAALQQVHNATDLKASAILPSVAAVIEVCTKVSRTLYLKIDALERRGRRRTHQIQTTATELSSLARILERLYDVLQNRSQLMAPAAYENTNSMLLFCKKALLKIEEVISTSKRTRSNFFRRDLLDASLGKARSVRHNLECLKTSLAAMTSTIVLAGQMAKKSAARSTESALVVSSNGGVEQSDSANGIYELDTPIDMLTTKLENDILAHTQAITRWQQAERADYHLLYAHGIESPTISPNSPAANWVAGLVPPLTLHGNDRRLTGPSLPRALTDGSQMSEASTSQIDLEEAEEEVRIAGVVKLLLGKWTQSPQSTLAGLNATIQNIDPETLPLSGNGHINSLTEETECPPYSNAESAFQLPENSVDGEGVRKSDENNFQIHRSKPYEGLTKTADAESSDKSNDTDQNQHRQTTTPHVNFLNPQVDDGRDSASDGTLSFVSSRPILSTPILPNSGGIDDLERLPKAGWEQSQLEEVYDWADTEYAGSETEEDVRSQWQNPSYTRDSAQYLDEPRLIGGSRHADRSVSATRSIGFAETIIESSSDGPRRSLPRSRSRGRSRPRKYYRDSRSGSRTSEVEYANGVRFDQSGDIQYAKKHTLRPVSPPISLGRIVEEVENGSGNLNGSNNHPKDSHWTFERQVSADTTSQPLSAHGDPLSSIPPSGPLKSDYSPNKADLEEANHYNERALEKAYLGESFHAATYRPESLDAPPGTIKITFDLSSQVQHVAWDGPPLPDWEVFDIPLQTVQVIMKGIGGAMQKITWQKYNGVRRSKFYPEGDNESNAGSDQLIQSPRTERPPPTEDAKSLSSTRDWEMVDVLALGSFMFALGVGLFTS